MLTTKRNRFQSKNLFEGDVLCSSQKVLGWIMNPIVRIIQLHDYDKEHLLSTLNSTIRQKSISQIKFQKLLGEIPIMFPDIIITKELLLRFQQSLTHVINHRDIITVGTKH